MTPEQLHIIQHSLGCDKYGQSKSRGRDEHDGCFGFHRNRYVSDPTPDLVALVSDGLMIDHGAQKLANGMHCYAVTRAGILAMDEQSPAPPKLTRGQTRYRAFLRCDFFDGTFIEFCQWMDWRKREGKEAV